MPAKRYCGRSRPWLRAIEICAMRRSGTPRKNAECSPRSTGACQPAKQLEAGLAREQQRRIQSQEAAAQTLEAGRRMLRETQQAAQQIERELRDQLVVQSGSLVQAQSHGAALQQRLEDLERQLNEEKKAHEGTHALLATTLADVRKPRATRRLASRQTK